MSNLVHRGRADATSGGAAAGPERVLESAQLVFEGANTGEAARGRRGRAQARAARAAQAGAAAGAAGAAGAAAAAEEVEEPAAAADATVGAAVDFVEAVLSSATVDAGPPTDVAPKTSNAKAVRGASGAFTHALLGRHMAAPVTIGNMAGLDLPVGKFSCEKDVQVYLEGVAMGASDHQLTAMFNTAAAGGRAKHFVTLPFVRSFGKKLKAARSAARFQDGREEMLKAFFRLVKSVANSTPWDEHVIVARPTAQPAPERERPPDPPYGGWCGSDGGGDSLSEPTAQSVPATLADPVAGLETQAGGGVGSAPGGQDSGTGSAGAKGRGDWPCAFATSKLILRMPVY